MTSVWALCTSTAAGWVSTPFLRTVSGTVSHRPRHEYDVACHMDVGSPWRESLDPLVDGAHRVDVAL